MSQKQSTRHFFLPCSILFINCIWSTVFFKILHLSGFTLKLSMSLMFADNNSASSSKYLFSCSLRLFSVLFHKENPVSVHHYHHIPFSDQVFNVYAFREIPIFIQSTKPDLGNNLNSYLKNRYYKIPKHRKQFWLKYIKRMTAVTDVFPQWCMYIDYFNDQWMLDIKRKQTVHILFAFGIILCSR